MLVSLMTTAVADNGWDPYESPVGETNKALCRCPLVRREPEDRFLVCAVMAQRLSP